MEGRPAATDDGMNRKQLEDGNFEEFIVGPAAQDAFTYGGEAGYLRYVYNEAKRRVDRNKAHPAQIVVIGRHEMGSEWPSVNYGSVDAQDGGPVVSRTADEKLPNTADKRGTLSASDASDQGSQNEGTNRKPQHSVMNRAFEANRANPLPGATEPAVGGQGDIGTDRQLAPPDLQGQADGDAAIDTDTPDQSADANAPLNSSAAETRELQATRDYLRAKREAYALLTAKRRSSGRDDLLEGPRFTLFMKRIFSPLEYRKAKAEQPQVAQARAEYKQAVEDYIAAIPGNETRKVRTKLSQMLLFERNVLHYQQELTYSGRDPNGQRERTRWDYTMLERARDWRINKQPQRRRGTILGAGGFAVGLVSGFLVPFSVPLMFGGTVAGAIGGAALGKREANEVNRYWPATEPGRAEIQGRVAEKLRNVFGYNRGMKKVDLPVQHEAIMGADTTVAHEELTHTAAADNASRSRRAAVYAGAILGGTFLAGNFGGSLIKGLIESASSGVNTLPQPTSTPTPTPSPTHAPTPTPTPNTVPTPPAGLGQEFPWDAAMQYNVAHHLSTTPSGVWNTLHNAATQYNQVHGTNFDYVLQPNGKFWLENGTRQITQTQLADFNQFLWNLAHP